MHPPLHLHKHPHCKEVSIPCRSLHTLATLVHRLTYCVVQFINALNQCHADNPIAKFWGVCNNQKIALDKCFRQEKRINRYASFCMQHIFVDTQRRRSIVGILLGSAINRQKAKEFQEKYQRSLAETAAQKQAAEQTA